MTSNLPGPIEGIFRVSGGAAEIGKLAQKVENGM
jgi:hypothetical protein